MLPASDTLTKHQAVGGVGEKSRHGAPSPFAIPQVGKFLPAFGSIAAPGASCAANAQSDTSEVAGGSHWLLLLSGFLFSFFLSRPTALPFDVDVDVTNPRLPFSLGGSRSQPSPYEVCLGRK
jgi:hypothetical protein